MAPAVLLGVHEHCTWSKEQPYTAFPQNNGYLENNVASCVLIYQNIAYVIYTTLLLSLFNTNYIMYTAHVISFKGGKDQRTWMLPSSSNPMSRKWC